MKLFLVGEEGRGKLKLVSIPHQFGLGDDHVLGIDINQLSYSKFGKPKFNFNIWNINNQEEYHATHQCFLSERSMYLLLWNVKHGEAGVAELKPWLDNISLRAPQSCVLIVGTHLDEVEDAERPKIDRLLNMVGELARQYPKLQIREVLAVGLMNRLENIGKLREAIYNCATKYKGKGNVPVMGQEIPGDYHRLIKEIESIQHGLCQGDGKVVMRFKEFKELVQRLQLPDISSDDELQTATLFLNEVGTILHYDDCSHNLNELYFIDPRWLCDMMYKVVPRNPFVKNGILDIKDIPLLFKDKCFLWELYCSLEQYLALLDRFEIAVLLDNKRILIPSMLPRERPGNADLPDGSFNKQYIVFQSPCPPGFWSRLIFRIMHTIPKTLGHSKKNGVQETESSLEQTTTSLGNSVTDESSAQQVAVSSPISAGPTPSKVPFELPNIRHFIVRKDVDIVYWREGIAYKSPDLSRFLHRVCR